MITSIHLVLGYQVCILGKDRFVKFGQRFVDHHDVMQSSCRAAGRLREIPKADLTTYRRDLDSFDNWACAMAHRDCLPIRLRIPLAADRMRPVTVNFLWRSL